MSQMKKIYLAFTLISVLFSSCMEEQFTILIHNHTEVAEIPFEYSSKGHIVAQSLIHGDTLNFIFDTGANLSIISTDIDDDGFLGSSLITDINQKKTP